MPFPVLYSVIPVLTLGVIVCATQMCGQQEVKIQLVSFHLVAQSICEKSQKFIIKGEAVSL